MKRIKVLAGALALSAALLAIVFTLRPLNDTAVIRQLEGINIGQTYLGRTLELAPGEFVEQTFTLPRAGRLDGIGLFFPSPNASAQGRIEVEVRRDPAKTGESIMTADTPIGRLSNNDGLHAWRFKAANVAAGETLTIKLTSRAEPSATIFIAREDALAGGDAVHKGQSMGRDIAFTAYYRQSWPEFWRYLEEDGPNIVGPLVLLFAVVGLFATMAWWWRGLYTAFGPDS